MLRKAIIKSFEPHIWNKYIIEIDEISTELLYRYALKNLKKGETERAISYIILTFESDNNFLPIQHLARTMLFSLSEEFIIKKGHKIKEKYRNLNLYVNSLCNKEENFRKEILIKKNIILQVEDKFENFSPFFKIINKKNIVSEIKQLEEDVIKLNSNIYDIKKEINSILELCNIEEYIRVITLVLDIIISPRKYKLML